MSTTRASTHQLLDWLECPVRSFNDTAIDPELRNESSVDDLERMASQAEASAAFLANLAAQAENKGATVEVFDNSDRSEKAIKQREKQTRAAIKKQVSVIGNPRLVSRTAISEPTALVYVEKQGDIEIKGYVPVIVVTGSPFEDVSSNEDWPVANLASWPLGLTSAEIQSEPKRPTRRAALRLAESHNILVSNKNETFEYGAVVGSNYSRGVLVDVSAKAFRAAYEFAPRGARQSAVEILAYAREGHAQVAALGRAALINPSGIAGPTPTKRTACAGCRYKTACSAKRVELDDVSSVPGVTRSSATTHRLLGTFTVQDLAKLSVLSLAEDEASTARDQAYRQFSVPSLAKTIETARAIKAKRSFKSRENWYPMDFGNVVASFDIEDGAIKNGARILPFAYAMSTGHPAGEPTTMSTEVFTSWDDDEHQALWEFDRFWKRLKTIRSEVTSQGGKFTAAVYSEHERASYNKLARLCGGMFGLPSQDEILSAFETDELGRPVNGGFVIDVLAYASNAYIWPTPTMSQKDLAPLLGFKYNDTAMNGQGAVAMYRNSFRYPEYAENLRKEIVSYNVEDTIALAYIIKWMVTDGLSAPSIATLDEQWEPEFKAAQAA